MPTNEERREVAERLRENAESNPRMGLLLNVAFADGSLRPEGSFEWEVSSHDAALRLADLIEPEERTCRNIADETYREFGEPFKCSECGADPHDGENFFCGFSSGEYDWHFCPNCGARVVPNE